MERIQLRLTGGNKLSSDSYVLVPRIPVKGDVIAPETAYDGAIYYTVEEVIFHWPSSVTLENDAGRNPAIKDDHSPSSVFVVARRGT